MTKKKTPKVRLPKNVIPKKYEITLTPDLDNFTFQGVEEIQLSIDKPTNKIALHAVEIEILSVALLQKGRSFLGKVSYETKHETVTFHFPQEVEGSARLKIVFNGILNDKMKGFYRSKYDLNGESYHLGVTQFESTDARRAIPCFDEPDKKAVFELTLKVPKDREAISNTIETEIREHEGGYKVIKFAPTPLMSSYLLAFIVGHFEHIEKKSDDGVLVRVFTTPGKKKQAEFALDVASRTLTFLSKYFDIPYPLQTLDLIAIPDFANGAMENWGAITYRETALLVDPEETAEKNRQWVALVIAHEIAHQWFGNLVTMEWWTHLWLNEGFASYMEYVVVDNLFPEWRIWSQFVSSEHERALSLDGLKNTHPIEVKVDHPSEINEIFDTVSYSKGASIIRMIAEYMGEKNFRNGLRYYLKKHQYSNASTEDLWKALEKSSGIPVGKIMKNWTSKPGYPLITFQDEGDKLYVSQSRFVSSPLYKIRDNTAWSVPLDIVMENDDEEYTLILHNKKMGLKHSEDDKWFKANMRETSFVRVKYPALNLWLLQKPIQEKDERLLESDRFGIIRDAFALAESGDLPTDDVLKLAIAYREEESFVVWEEITSNILRIKNLLAGTKIEKEFNLYARKLFESIVEKVGWEKEAGEPSERTLLRSTVLYGAGVCGDKTVLDKAREIYKKSKKDKKPIHSDIRGVVYALVAESGGEKEFHEFMEMYGKVSFQEEQGRIIRAMCQFHDKKLLEHALNFAFSKEFRAQDAFKVITLVWANPHGRELAWNYVKENWSDIIEKFYAHLARFAAPAANFTTFEKADEVERFFAKNKTDGAERTIAQAIEQINSNAAWLSRDMKRIEEFVTQF